MFQKGSSEDLSSGNTHVSPLWGEPGRRLPTVNSLLHLGPLTSNLPSNDPDIEDFGKNTSDRQELLLEELVQASPKVAVQFSTTESSNGSEHICPQCKQESKFRIQSIYER